MPFEDKKEKWPSQVTAIKAFESYVLREISASLILLKNLKTMTGFGSSCGACKFLRRKCTSDCVFAPFFCYDEAATHFAAVHKVFGASNASRLLLHLPVQKRSEAAITISYEALARMQDPVYGCVAHIYALQQQVASLQEEIDILENQMANSHVGFAGCDSSFQAFPNKGIEFPLQHDIMKTQYCQNQLANMLSSEGNATIYQSLDEQIGIEFPQALGDLEDHLFGESNPIPLENLVSGIDQEVFANHPWFNYNVNIIN